MKKISIFILFLISVFLFGFIFWNDIIDIYSKLSLKLPEVGKEITDFLAKEAEKVISTPPPLISETENPQSFLTKEGVIKWTNNQRVKYGLPPLTENNKLDAIAKAKVEDMFLEQYFAHQSPEGEGVGDLAKNFGYDFIVIGENLALGDYEDDEALVQAWMDSTGHRENILNNRYQEIGVSVEKGIYEGRTTWLAVQHFGLPLASCPSPDEETKSAIELNQDKISIFQTTLNNLKIEIQNMRPKRGELYNQKIEEYNILVNQYNNLVEETKSLILQYNIEVNKFNECVTAGT